MPNPNRSCASGRFTSSRATRHAPLVDPPAAYQAQSQDTPSMTTDAQLHDVTERLLASATSTLLIAGSDGSAAEGEMAPDLAHDPRTRFKQMAAGLKTQLAQIKTALNQNQVQAAALDSKAENRLDDLAGLQQALATARKQLDEVMFTSPLFAGTAAEQSHANRVAQLASQVRQAEAALTQAQELAQVALAQDAEERAALEHSNADLTAQHEKLASMLETLLVQSQEHTRQQLTADLARVQARSAAIAEMRAEAAKLLATADAEAGALAEQVRQQGKSVPAWGARARRYLPKAPSAIEQLVEHFRMIDTLLDASQLGGLSEWERAQIASPSGPRSLVPLLLSVHDLELIANESWQQATSDPGSRGQLLLAQREAARQHVLDVYGLTPGSTGQSVQVQGAPSTQAAPRVSSLAMSEQGYAEQMQHQSATYRYAQTTGSFDQESQRMREYENRLAAVQQAVGSGQMTPEEGQQALASQRQVG